MKVLILGSLGGELGRAARIARDAGAKLDQADTATSALVRLRADARVDLLLVELPHDIGALVASLRAERIAVPIVACGADTGPDEAAAAIRAGAREFMPLPPDPELIAAILHQASGESHTMIARDPCMLACLRRADQVAASEASILITGESGTGKEVMARHIHRRSRRAGGPFVAMNCAALPENLLESEMFGHEKGAFTGAVARRVGKFEAADGGTLLLDEISEMDVRLQAKLLRAIQEREIDRVGGAGPVRIDVRLLATSNRDLPAEVAAGRFREDLYFRLNVVSLCIPPLRDRPGDVVALAEHYARHFAELNGVRVRAVSAGAARRLTEHTWRGNVRELENTLHRAVLLAEGDAIGEAAVELTTPSLATPSLTTPSLTKPSLATQGEPARLPRSVSGLVGRTMEEVERDLIVETLTHTLGNRTHAATILGISIRALRNKLRDYTQAGVAVPPPAGAVHA